MGFDSAIATTLNFLPKLAVNIKKAIKENKVQEARDLQMKLTEACSVITADGKSNSIFLVKVINWNNFFAGTWVPTMKVAMSLVTDIDPGFARPPLTNLTSKEIEKMKTALKSLKIID